MGREIRRVPPGWQHPKDKRGHYMPLYDKDYESALAEYQQRLDDWDNDVGGERSRAQEKHPDITLGEWDGGPPDRDYYRQKWGDDNPATHYQVYEDVSEGTPVSPVLASLKEMKGWLLSQGFSEHATDKFIELEWAPSMIFTPEKGVSGIGIHSLDWLSD